KHPHPSIKLFFEDLIFERKKRTVQSNYVKTSIDVLDEARTHGVLDMPEALGTKPTKRRSKDGKIKNQSAMMTIIMTILERCLHWITKNIKKAYDEMDDAKKWVLTTGTVENALYDFGLRCKHEQ
ncbi:9279_t:CDS:2, partial [Ambispora gerdemannii]